MPIPRNRPHFKATTSQDEVPAPVERPLSFVRSAMVGALIWRHYALLFLSIAWIILGVASIGAGCAAYAGMLPKLTDDQIAFGGIALIATGFLEIITAIGCLLRAKWGRVCAFVLAFVWLVSLFGAIPSLLVFFVLFRSAPLFGPTRFYGPELAEEHRYRKRRASQS